jgi:hypothetical protein
MSAGLILVVPAKGDDERDRVAEAWRAEGGEVLALDRFWEPPPLERSRVRLYGADAFCLVLAQKLNLTLLSPPDDLLLHLDREALGRSVQGGIFANARTLSYPTFIKPQVPKLFRAGVYDSPEALSRECTGLEPDAALLISEVVRFVAEVRAFVLDGEVRTCALYEGTASLPDAEVFVRSVVKRMSTALALPETYVLDVGLIEGHGWAVIEANATWGAGLNGCNPGEVARCIARATR